MRKTYEMHYSMGFWQSTTFNLCAAGVNQWVEIPPDVDRIELVISTRPLNQQSLEVTFNNFHCYVDGRYCRLSFTATTAMHHVLRLSKKFYATIYYEEKV